MGSNLLLIFLLLKEHFVLQMGALVVPLIEQRSIIDILGWIGAAAILAAYGLVSTKKLAGDSVTYQGLNILGGLLLIVNSFYYGAIPSVTVNVVWIGIAVFSLARRRGSAGEI